MRSRTVFSLNEVMNTFAIPVYRVVAAILCCTQMVEVVLFPGPLHSNSNIDVNTLY